MNQCEECGKMINWTIELQFTPAKESKHRDLNYIYCRECAIKLLEGDFVKQRIIDEG